MKNWTLLSMSVSRMNKLGGLWLLRCLRPASLPSSYLSDVSHFKRPHFVPQRNLSQFTIIRPFSFSARLLSTQVDKQLADFLKDEIEAEKKIALQRLPSGSSPSMTGFQVKTDEAEISLTKSHGNEKVTVRFNVNHTVDPEVSTELEGQTQHKEQPGPMISKPDFQVEVAKDNKKLVFECYYTENHEESEGTAAEGAEDTELFGISELYVYSGDSADKSYSVSTDVIDGTLYDYLMNYLGERGIDDKFAKDLIDFATHYEHAQYVALLQQIKDFVAK